MSTSGLDFESLIRACRKAGLKATHQRMEIYRELAQTEDHPDAETIFKRNDAVRLEAIKAEVRALVDAHPLYPEL